MWQIKTKSLHRYHPPSKVIYNPAAWELRTLQQKNDADTNPFRIRVYIRDIKT